MLLPRKGLKVLQRTGIGATPVAAAQQQGQGNSVGCHVANIWSVCCWFASSQVCTELEGLQLLLYCLFLC
jgi:hypothetical protein